MQHPATQQILVASSQMGWSAEMISEQLDIPLIQVQAVIASQKGVDALLQEGGDLKSPEDILQMLRNLVLTSESPKVKLEALKYLHGEVTGRNDLPKEHLELKKQKLQLEAVNTAVNIKRFNASISKARELISSVQVPRVVDQQQLLKAS